MTEPQGTNPSNQSDTPSESQQTSPSKPSNPTPPPKPEVIFTLDDMVEANLSRDMTGAETFTISTPLQSDE